MPVLRCLWSDADNSPGAAAVINDCRQVTTPGLRPIVSRTRVRFEPASTACRAMLAGINHGG